MIGCNVEVLLLVLLLVVSLLNNNRTVQSTPSFFIKNYPQNSTSVASMSSSLM
jgi:hypothetical protein